MEMEHSKWCRKQKSRLNVLGFDKDPSCEGLKDTSCELARAMIVDENHLADSQGGMSSFTRLRSMTAYFPSSFYMSYNITTMLGTMSRKGRQCFSTDLAVIGLGLDALSLNNAFVHRCCSTVKPIQICKFFAESFLPGC
jgi:hypothetical protein